MRTLLLLAIFMASGLNAHADSVPKLRLYFLPTYPVRLDWSTPHSLLDSAISGLIRNRTEPIGHVNIEVDCGAGQSELFGAVGAGAGPIGKLLLEEQVGFSLLERGWVGSLEARNHILGTFKARGRDPRQMSVVTFEISATTCERLEEYAHRYAAETKPIYYGFAPRPRHREGSGCSAFGASFAEVAGLLTPELNEAWTTERLVPLTLMAGHAGKTTIPILKVRSSPEAQRWATPAEGHMDLTFFDPDRMYEWVVSLTKDPAKLADLRGTLDQDLPYGIAGVPAIRLDRRHVATPDEPLFDGEPSLRAVGPDSVERTDVRYGVDGSFALKP